MNLVNGKKVRSFDYEYREYKTVVKVEQTQLFLKVPKNYKRPLEIIPKRDKKDLYPLTGIDSYIFRLPRHYINPYKVKGKDSKTNLHGKRSISLVAEEKSVLIRLQHEAMPAECDPWEIVSKHIINLILQGYFVLPISRKHELLEDCTDVIPLNDYYPIKNRYKFDLNTIKTVDDLIEHILDKVVACRLDYFRDFRDNLEYFNLPESAVPYTEYDRKANGFYQKSHKSRVKLYHRYDKDKVNFVRFEVELTDGYPLKNFKTIGSMRNLRLSCKRRALSLALDKRGYRASPTHDEYTLWLWLDRFLEYGSKRRLKLNGSYMTAPPKGYREKRLYAFEKQHKVIGDLLKGLTRKKIEKKYTEEKDGFTVYSDYISRVIRES